MSVDLPTFGKPTSATSAMSLSSSHIQRSWPTSPCSAKPGARRLLDKNLALPFPPMPPSAASQRSRSWTRSARISPSRSLTVVPIGTCTYRSSPPWPCFFLPEPCDPFVALRCGWSRNDNSDATFRSATSHTSPPDPPSPPSGPPMATCASRRNEVHPAPPSPPLTFRPHSSTKFDTQ